MIDLLDSRNLNARTPLLLPPDDRAEFYSYPPDEQESIRALHHAMMIIAAAPNPNQGCKTAAKGRSGWSAKYLRTLFDSWQDEGEDWRTLIDKRRFPDAREPELPPQMQAHIRVKFSENQRKNKPAWRQIIRQWERWLLTGDPRHALPGYSSCPPPGARGRYPRGLSYKNCNRYAPTRAESAIARIGVHAGISILPDIPGTREGARFMEWVSGDDVWLKRKAMVPGFGPLRVLQFGLMDYAGSYYLERFVQRPETPRDDGTNIRLKRRDFLWCLAMHLEHYGYPMDYVMHLPLERGTATTSAAEARFLYEVSEGHIVVGYNTMDGQMVHAWDERHTGRSNSKSWHESFHNLFANEEADLAGQVGKDRDHSPAALQGRERHAIALNNAACILTPEQRARLRFPFPGLQECYAQSLERVQWINNRKDHECEGFATIMDWRPAGLRCLPLPEADLPAWLAANPRADTDTDVEWFPRPETPHERVMRLSQGSRFMRLPSGVWRRFYEDLHESDEVKADGRLSFTCRQTKRKLWFEPESPEDAIRPGTKVTGFYRPDGSAIHLYGENDRFIVTWPAVQRTRRDDAVAKQEAFARNRRSLNEALANVREATAPEVERAQADSLNNEQVLFENGLMPASAAQELAFVNEGCTPIAAAVQAITEQQDETEREQRAVRSVDVVRDMLSRPERAETVNAHDFF